MSDHTPDLLYGAPAIASFLGLKEKQCRHRIEKGLIPTFRIGGTICALRSQLNAWLHEQASGARSGANV